MIENMCNHNIRERLLADENIGLDKAIVIAVRLEYTIRDAKTMDPHRLSDHFDKTVNVVKYNKHYVRNENNRSMTNRMRRSVTDVVPHNTKRIIHNAQHCTRNAENVRKLTFRKCMLCKWKRCSCSTTVTQ